MLADAHGPILDLGGDVSPIGGGDWGSSRTVEVTTLGGVQDPTKALEGIAHSDGGDASFAEIIGVLVTPHVADLLRLFTAVERLLRAEGRYLFVEPDAVASKWGDLTAPALRSLSGLELGRDITGAMWNSGLSVARVDRRPVRSTTWPLRNLIAGVARHAPLDDPRSRRS